MNMPTLASLRFDNRLVRAMPADPEPGNFPRQVSGALYSRVKPRPVRAPRLIAYAVEVAELLGLSEADCRSPAFVRVMAGNALLDGMEPHATCYGGHQFGNWAGQLGDGRAINLGEVRSEGGEHWTLQLKGAGPTPYSRTADGLAVLRSSLREFLCSEAMHHLGVPTTRALALVATGESVIRDILYDGHPAPEPGAVLCRVARSFTRFGHFEILAARREFDLLRRFVDFTIDADFPGLAPFKGVDRDLAWFADVCERTAEMIVEWMRVGFVHGVMNTDNMSVLGLTIDYGPYGWLEGYDPDWTPNTTDAVGRRYRFANQPVIAHWNLARLASAIYPLVGDPAPLQDILGQFGERYQRLYCEMMAKKLGFAKFVARTDEALLRELEAVLTATETDMTIFFRRLAEVRADTPRRDALETLAEAWYQPERAPRAAAERLWNWVSAYQRRLLADGRPDAERRRQMQATNPKYVLRNYLAQLAIEKAEAGDHRLLHELMDLLRRPYDEQPQRQRFFAKRPEWARNRVGCSMLSCSS